MDKTRSLKMLAACLQSSEITVAVAESCSGGLLAAALTELPGSSMWFDRGFVTYSNAAKQELLGVSEKTLSLYGAVSEQTAQAMARGALKNSQAHITLAITGIAGPEGGSTEKPVGTVWFGLANKDGFLAAYQQHFSGTRTTIRAKSVNFALGLLHDHLRGKK